MPRIPRIVKLHLFLSTMIMEKCHEDYPYCIVGNFIFSATAYSAERIDVSTLPLQNSFAVTHGNGQRTLYVFLDPESYYAKKLAKELEKLNNVTIHYFLILFSSVEKSNAVWCAPDRAAAWSRLVRTGKWMVMG